ncbi:MAG: hypothetical protein L0241_01455 [Planctomycetia bacterium]|nr:hypothetical protein [Planctomycetia bacterium]
MELQRMAIRLTDGRIVAYVLPVGEIRALRANLESLRDQIARGEGVGSYYVTELTRLANSLLPQPLDAVEWQPAPEDSGAQPHVIVDSVEE